VYDIPQATKDYCELVVPWIEEAIEQFMPMFTHTRSGEKLIGKKFEEFTPQDFQRLYMLKGQEFFEDFFVDKKYEQVRELEAS